ncbi:MAG: AAA family ATPase [Candidatus Limnocylindrales bacterium]
MTTKFHPAWLERHRVELPPVDRASIVGLDHVMSELGSLTGRLADVEGAALLRADLPKGVLFHGPAGVGKTLVARYLGGILGPAAPMYELSSDELSPARLRGALRHLAERERPAVLYIDEIDQWALARSAPMHSPATRLLLTAALAGLDGLRPTDGPLVIASSNQPPRALDPALVRPGRLGVHVRFDPPDEAERVTLFERFLAGRPLAGLPDLGRLARLTRGATPAAIRAYCDDAAGLTLAAGRRAIGEADLIAAIRRDGEIGPGELATDPVRRHRVAIHEAGHVAVCVALRGRAWPYAVAIKPSGGGGTRFGTEGEARVEPDDEIRDGIVVAFGGLAAERAVFGEPSLASSGDVDWATERAFARLEAGVEPACPPLSLSVLGQQAAEEAKSRANAVLALLLDDARSEAARLVEAAIGPIERFAAILEAAGELTGADLRAAIEAAGLVGPAPERTPGRATSRATSDERA